MRIALYSDLHLETMHEEQWCPPGLDVDVVILAGDIGRHTDSLDWAAKAFRQCPVSPAIIYVAGNHEYYGTHLGLLDELQAPVWEQSGVHFLEKRTFEMDGIRFLGCTLWSGFDLSGVESVEASMDAAARGINDYWMICTRDGKRLEPRDTLRLHREAVRWLDNELEKPFEGKTVVVTHFAPHRRCVAAEHRNSPVSPYFVTDLSQLMVRHKIDLWCYGHTHTNCDFIAENGCRVLSNQRGYPTEAISNRTGFREEIIVEFQTAAR